MTETNLFYTNNNAIEIKILGQISQDLIGTSPKIFRGLLNRGEILAITAPKKSLKTSIAISLALSLAQGSEWLEWHSERAFKVLFINTNHQENDCFYRFKQIAQLTNVNQEVLNHISIMTLPKASSIEELLRSIKSNIQPKSFQVVIIDSIDNLKFSQFGDKLGHCLQQINNHITGGLIYTQSHKDQPKGNLESQKMAQWSESLDHCDSLIEFFKMELDPDLLRLERLVAIWDLTKTVLNTHNKRYFQLNITDKYINPKNKQATSEDLRNHIEIALEHLPPETLYDILQRFDKIDIPLKTRTYWRMEVVTSGVDYEGKKNFLFYYPQLVNDEGNILAHHEPGLPLAKEYREGLIAKELAQEEATSKLASMITEFEEKNNRLPKKTELSSFSGVSRPTIDKLINQSNGNIVVIGGLVQENPAI